MVLSNIELQALFVQFQEHLGAVAMHQMQIRARNNNVDLLVQLLNEANDDNAENIVNIIKDMPRSPFATICTDAAKHRNTYLGIACMDAPLNVIMAVYHKTFEKMGNGTWEGLTTDGYSFMPPYFYVLINNNCEKILPEILPLLNINFESVSGFTLLTHALRNNGVSRNIIEIILLAGADVNIPYDLPPLYLAMQRKDVTIIKLLRILGANLDFKFHPNPAHFPESKFAEQKLVDLFKEATLQVRKVYTTPLEKLLTARGPDELPLRVMAQIYNVAHAQDKNAKSRPRLLNDVQLLLKNPRVIKSLEDEIKDIRNDRREKKNMKCHNENNDFSEYSEFDVITVKSASGKNICYLRSELATAIYDRKHVTGEPMTGDNITT